MIKFGRVVVIVCSVGIFSHLHFLFFFRNILPAEGGGGDHRRGGGGWRLLLLWARSSPPHALLQRGLWSALVGLGSGRHQICARGLQHQWQQCSIHASSVWPTQDPHHILCQGQFHSDKNNSNKSTAVWDSEQWSKYLLLRVSSIMWAARPNWRNGWPMRRCRKLCGPASTLPMWTVIPPST